MFYFSSPVWTVDLSIPLIGNYPERMEWTPRFEHEWLVISLFSDWLCFNLVLLLLEYKSGHLMTSQWKFCSTCCPWLAKRFLDIVFCILNPTSWSIEIWYCFVNIFKKLQYFTPTISRIFSFVWCHLYLVEYIYLNMPRM